MKPTFIPDYAPSFLPGSIYKLLMTEVHWQDAGAPRMKCFMSATPMTYGYATRQGDRFYDSIPYHPTVLSLQNKLNEEFGTNYNVCFLNYYENEKQHLGWHADDSVGMDLDHPIAVISYGESRHIYVKDKTFKGKIEDEGKFMLTSGSLFIMPAGYQRDHFHKIPKGDREMTGRISLTFRHYIPE